MFYSDILILDDDGGYKKLSVLFDGRVIRVNPTNEPVLNATGKLFKLCLINEPTRYGFIYVLRGKSMIHYCDEIFPPNTSSSEISEFLTYVKAGATDFGFIKKVLGF